MVTMWISSWKFFLLLTLFSCLHLLTMASFHYEVGESEGWVVPPSNDDGFYNEWASKKRFLVGDTIVFKYKKDSVMAVTEDDYNQCNSTHPIFFANNGNTMYKLDRPGLFYFMSGVSGHCEKGQKLIIKVLGHDTSSPPTNPPPPPQPNAALPRTRIPYIVGAPQFIILVLGFLFLQF